MGVFCWTSLESCTQIRVFFPFRSVKAKIMSMLLRMPLLPFLIGPIVSAPLAGVCSKVIEVLGKGNVDGVYHLVKEAAEKRDDVCVDGCVYTKDQEPGSEYCFAKQTSLEKGAVSSCAAGGEGCGHQVARWGKWAEKRKSVPDRIIKQRMRTVK